MSNLPKKILIVEDEKPLARALELKLNHSGFETKLASDGEEALSILEDEKFNLIILDLILPKMDGFEILSKLKERKNNIPVIVASNLSQLEDQKRAKELGVIDYFVKSDVSLVEIVKIVKKGIKQ